MRYESPGFAGFEDAVHIQIPIPIVIRDRHVIPPVRLDDGGSFDFRGSKEHSIGRSEATLSDSNERASKGFVSTLELKGKITVELKLDWIFVKPAQLTHPDDRKQPYLMAPQFGRTLKALNYSLKDRISDHNPLIVDLRW